MSNRRRLVAASFRQNHATVAPVPLSPRQSAGVFYLIALGYRSPMGLWDRPNILDAKSGLRPREIAVVFAIIAALCVVVAIVLL
jgi:hypothetical protein